MSHTSPGAAAGGRRTDRRLLAGFALLFVLSLPAVTPRIYASDEIEFFAFLRSLWFDHDLSFENEYQHFYDIGTAHSDGFHWTFLELTTETGLRHNFGTIGPAILWLPFYAVGDLVARSLHAEGRPIALDGYSKPYIAAVAYGSAVCGWLSVVLSVFIARRVLGFDPRSTTTASAASLAVWLGTPLVFYTYIAPPMSHAPSAFAISAFVLTWLIVRERWSLRGFIALGALAGLIAMIREQDALFVIGPALDFLWSLVQRVRGGPAALRAPWHRVAGQALAGCAAAAVCYSPQAIAYITLNGRLGPSHIIMRKISWTAPYALRVIASPEHGFLVWTPLALLSVAGLLMLAFGRTGSADRRVIGLCMLAMLVAQVWISGGYESWSAAGAFGQRRLVGLTPLLAVGLAVLLRRVDRRAPRLALAAAVTLGVWWNLGLIMQFSVGLMDRQRLELGRIAYNNFLVVPRRLPELAYRYAFDRQSFYQSTRRP